MQLKPQKSIVSAVTAITATLLGSGTAAASGEKSIDSSLLLYSEKDRVQAAEGVVDFGLALNERRSVGVRLTFDGLTGASPNGATPSSRIQTFTSPSGTAAYVVKPGETPLDDTFKDVRGALDARLRQALDRLTVANVGAHMSFEQDYTSLGVNGSITRDFNRRNTTIGLAAAYSHDIVSPMGGAPVPFASMPPPQEAEGEDEEGEGGPGEGKDVIDLVASLTQVLGRKTVFRANYSMSRSSGYLNDPYKLMSVVQDRNSAEPGEPVDYVYEGRPDVRLKQAIFGELRRHISGVTLNLSYRYFWDDWGVKSHTSDVFVRVPIGGGHAVEPHLRWYTQSEADFFNEYLIEGQAFPDHASADSRLTAFDAYTLGLQYLMPLAPAMQLRISGEYYTQNGTRAPPADFGVLSVYDLFPALDVFMLRVGFSYGF